MLPWHVIFARDLIQFNLIHGIKSIAHIFRIFSKAQVFEMPKNQGVITWRTYDFFYSSWAFPLDQPSLIIGWPFYTHLFIILKSYLL